MASKQPAPSFDILLAGIGVGGPGRTTAEVLDALRRVRRIFSLSVHEVFLRALGPEFVSLDEIYYSGEEDVRVYDRIARLVLEEGRRQPPIALVDDGHPLIYDDVNRLILQRGRRKGLNVLAMPAVSFLDALVIEGTVPFDGTGLQIVEASTLVSKRQRLNPDFNTLILQIGWFGISELHDGDGLRSDALRPLQEHLERFFPPDHPVRVVRAGNGDIGRRKRQLRLGSLAAAGLRIEPDCSLFVPRALLEKRTRLARKRGRP